MQMAHLRTLSFSCTLIGSRSLVLEPLYTIVPPRISPRNGEKVGNVAKGFSFS